MDHTTRVRSLTGIPITKVPDADILVYISEAEEEFVRLTGKTIDEAAKADEPYDGKGKDTLMLDNYPLTEVTVIKLKDAVQDLTKFRIYNQTGKIIWENGIFPEGRQNVKVTYKHGYTTRPKVVDDYIVNFAAKRTCQQAGAKEAEGAGSETFEEYSVTYRNGIPYSGMIEQLEGAMETALKGFGKKARAKIF